MFQFARGARILLAMAIRVALIGTGNCGSLALRQLIEDDRFELTDGLITRQDVWNDIAEERP